MWCSPIAPLGGRTSSIGRYDGWVEAHLSDSRDGIVVVAGAGGFIGGHRRARSSANRVGPFALIDIKPLSDWHQVIEGVENVTLDLSEKGACVAALDDANSVFNLASDMGGMGFIERNKTLCMLSVLVNTHLLMAARQQRVHRYFFASSACVYAADKQATEDAIPLAEADAYPAMPEAATGGRSFSTSGCVATSGKISGSRRASLAITTCMAHSARGPAGARRHLPRLVGKITVAKLSGRHEIEVWGDGDRSGPSRMSTTASTVRCGSWATGSTNR